MQHSIIFNYLVSHYFFSNPFSFSSITYWLVLIAIFYLVLTYRQHENGGGLAYRIGLTLAFVLIMVMLAPRFRVYANLVINTTRDSHKLSAADLQAEYLRARIVAPNAGLLCTRAERDWDYVCSYTPTPLQPKTRMQFGVIVDETHVLKTSRRVPEGTNLPPPQ